jgi:tRNA pseudouridine38-40 synthase
MPRYALKIEYTGTPFVGWQRQIDLQSVQGAVEAALAKLDPSEPKIVGAGRTDSGVHALGQVAHVDLQNDWSPYRLSEALNYHLKPLPVAAVQVALATDDFHARFSAIERSYLFRLVARSAPLTHDVDRVWRVRRHLDLQAMQQAASHLIGRHDFTTFRSTVCQAESPLRTLDELSITEHPYPAGIEYRFVVRARSFLHNQVRSFVGTLERVGAGSWAPDAVATALAARDRAACGPVCPPQGLYLAHVKYPDDPFEKVAK